MSTEQKYNVVFAGAINEGFESHQVQQFFVEKLKLSKSKVDLYFSGKRVILKKSITLQKAEQMQQKLLSIGAETLVVPSIDANDTLNAKFKNQAYKQNKQNKLNVKNSNQKNESLTDQDKKSLLEVNAEKSQTPPPLNDQELAKKVALAQSMMIEEQLKSQINNKQSNVSYKKLTFFGLFLIVAILFLTYYLDTGF